MPKMIGTINGYVKSTAKFGRKKFDFDGTTLGLVRAALATGAKVGDTIRADYGAGFKPYTLYSNPMDDRAGGVWAQ
jgi:hypothetical protein